MPWSPVEIPLQRERRFIRAAIMRNGQRALLKRTSKRPPTTYGSASARAMAAVAPSGSTVSACRNRSASPRAAAAPAFICRARPRGLSTNRTEGERPHHSGARVRAAPVGDDDLRVRAAGHEIGKQPLEIGRLVQRGDDDAQHSRGSRRRAQRDRAVVRHRARPGVIGVSHNARPAIGDRPHPTDTPLRAPASPAQSDSAFGGGSEGAVEAPFDAAFTGSTRASARTAASRAG